jgi:hypothetical protein
MAAKLFQFPLPDDTFDLFDYVRAPVASRRRRRSRRLPPGSPGERWTPVITDDWPEHIYVSDAEIDVFEAQFGDLLDDLFNPGK